jgi:hypothetical protein
MEAKKPIFIIGSGRCGSTIVFEGLSVHPDLGWFSNYNKLFPKTGMVSLLPRLTNLPLLRKIGRGEKKQYSQGNSWFNKFLPIPMECYTKWRFLLGDKFSFDFLNNQIATDEEIQRVKTAVRQVLFWQGKKRFAAKYTGPTRMTFMRSIFPDAKFIHIKRDFRAVVFSLLDVDFWTDQQGRKLPRWTGGLAEDWEQEWKHYRSSPIALAAMQYRAIMQICQQEQAQLSKGAYMEIRYEDFVEAPQQMMKLIIEFCGLEPSKEVESFINSHKYTNMNKKYIEKMTPEESELIKHIVGNYQ